MAGEEFSYTSNRNGDTKAKSQINCGHCNNPTPVIISIGSMPIGGRGLSCTYVVRCVICNEDTFIIVNDGVIVDQYPRAKGKISEDIPKGIREDYEEALICLNSNAYKATVAMCRRALQKSTEKEGANTKERLVDQIEFLFKKGIIPKGLYELATEVRFFGNYGAHPRNDDLEKITEDDAKDVLDFLSHYLEHVYVMSAKVNRKRKERTSRKNKK